MVTPRCSALRFCPVVPFMHSLTRLVTNTSVLCAVISYHPAAGCDFSTAGLRSVRRTILLCSADLIRAAIRGSYRRAEYLFHAGLLICSQRWRNLRCSTSAGSGAVRDNSACAVRNSSGAVCDSSGTIRNRSGAVCSLTYPVRFSSASSLHPSNRRARAVRAVGPAAVRSLCPAAAVHTAAICTAVRTAAVRTAAVRTAGVRPATKFAIVVVMK